MCCASMISLSKVEYVAARDVPDMPLGLTKEGKRQSKHIVDRLNPQPA